MVFIGAAIRLKTGFYETKVYNLQISRGKLQLLSKELDGQIITIDEKDIQIVTVKNKKSLEIKIQTSEKIYLGTFIHKSDCTILFNQIKENLNIKVFFEFAKEILPG